MRVILQGLLIGGLKLLLPEYTSSPMRLYYFAPFLLNKTTQTRNNINNDNNNKYICMYIYLTNRFQVAVRLFSNRSQMTSKRGKNKKVAQTAQPSVSLMFLPHFNVLRDLLLNRRTATWNLFVLYNKELEKVLMMTSSICLSSNRS